MAARSRTYYELFGVPPDCTLAELRVAYRRLARERHPDVASPRPGLGSMAEINEAWDVLSDERSRRRYDESVRVEHRLPPSPASSPAPSPPSSGARRRMWTAGLQAQMARLSRQAGRSATQALLIRHPRGPRSRYEAVLDELVAELATDTESRARAARAAGAAPLDLASAAALVGVRSVADGLRRQASLEITEELLIKAELLDRMWDIMGHELPAALATTLGGNPRVARAIRQ